MKVVTNFAVMRYDRIRERTKITLLEGYAFRTYTLLYCIYSLNFLHECSNKDYCACITASTSFFSIIKVLGQMDNKFLDFILASVNIHHTSAYLLLYFAGQNETAISLMSAAKTCGTRHRRQVSFPIKIKTLQRWETRG